MVDRTAKVAHHRVLFVNSDAIKLFYAGIVCQAFLLLIGRLKPKDILYVLGLCAVSTAGFIPGKREHNYDVSDHFFIVACIFAIGYALVFKKKVLQRINKEILLVWTLVGLYTALQIPFIVSHHQLLFLLLTLSLLAVINAFAGFDKSYVWKIYFYIWFLCVIVGIIASQFAFSTLFSIFGHTVVQIEPLTMFAIGMSFLYLVINLWFVIELIPLPGKHQSLSDRLEEVEEAMDILAEGYEVEQAGLWKTSLLFILSASLLAINYFHHLVSDTILISVLIAILPVMDRFFGNPISTSVALQDDGDNSEV